METLDPTGYDRPLIAGFNKTVKLIKNASAAKVFLASDADSDIVSQVRALCRAGDVPLDEQYDKKALGQLCGIRVGCAAAVIPK